MGDTVTFDFCNHSTIGKALDFAHMHAATKNAEGIVDSARAELGHLQEIKAKARERELLVRAVEDFIRDNRISIDEFGDVVWIGEKPNTDAVLRMYTLVHGAVAVRKRDA